MIVPIDIVRKHIYPLLDYDSKIEMNKVLHPEDRLFTKFPIGFAEKHEIQYLGCILDETIIRNTRNTPVYIFRILRLPRFKTIIVSNARLRAALITKATEMVSIENKTRFGLTKSQAYKFTKNCKKVIKLYA